MCSSSGDIAIIPNNVTVSGPSDNGTTGNNFTIPAKDTEYVKVGLKYCVDYTNVCYDCIIQYLQNMLDY